MPPGTRTSPEPHTPSDPHFTSRYPLASLGRGPQRGCEQPREEGSITGDGHQDQVAGGGCQMEWHAALLLSCPSPHHHQHQHQEQGHRWHCHSPQPEPAGKRKQHGNAVISSQAEMFEK